MSYICVVKITQLKKQNIMKTLITIDKEISKSYAYELAKEDLYKIDRLSCIVKFTDDTISIGFEEYEAEDAEEVEKQITDILFHTIGGEFDIDYSNEH